VTAMLRTSRLMTWRVVAILGLALICAPAAHAAFPGANGRIAFVSERDGNFEIYTANPDGTDPVRLTDDPSFDQDPTWSADGRRIAFASDRDGDYDIYLMNADGSGLAKVTDDAADEVGPSWAPDGTRLVFWRAGIPPDTELYVVNVDGTGLTPITGGASFSRDPVWSPDGSQIAFVSARSGSFRLYLVNPDGTGLVDLASGVDGLIWPDWSPDATRLVFSDGFSISTIDRDGSGLSTIVADSIRPDGGSDHRTLPVWSPAGDKIAYSTRTCYIRGCTPFSTVILNPDGTGATSPEGLGLGPDWQPIVAPQGGNGPQLCRGERARLDADAFAAKYGTNRNGANAFGKCVTRHGSG
jgi:Tol biopolymer transport system component